MVVAYYFCSCSGSCFPLGAQGGKYTLILVKFDLNLSLTILDRYHVYPWGKGRYWNGQCIVPHFPSMRLYNIT